MPENRPESGPSREPNSATNRLEEALLNLDKYLSDSEGAPASASEVSEVAGSPSTAEVEVQPALPAGDELRPDIPVIDEGAPAPLDDRSLRLLTQFAAGAAVMGVEWALERLRYWDEQAPDDPLAAGGEPLADASPMVLARYLLIGTIAWGRRQVVEAVYANLPVSSGGRGPLLRSLDRFTSLWPLRTIRTPIRNAAAKSAAAAGERIREGWQEEQAGRWLASQTIPQIMDAVIDRIAQNPELAAAIRNQLGVQSVGLVTTVRDTGRSWSTTADDAVESVARRLLRRPPRPEQAVPSNPPPDSEDLYDEY